MLVRLGRQEDRTTCRYLGERSNSTCTRTPDLLRNRRADLGTQRGRRCQLPTHDRKQPLDSLGRVIDQE